MTVAKVLEQRGNRNWERPFASRPSASGATNITPMSKPSDVKLEYSHVERKSIAENPFASRSPLIC